MDKIKNYSNNTKYFHDIANGIKYTPINLNYYCKYYNVDKLVMAIYCQGMFIQLGEVNGNVETTFIKLIHSELLIIERYLKVRKLIIKIELNNY